MACGGCKKQRQELKEATKERNVRKMVVTAIDGVAMMAGLKEKPKVEEVAEPKKAAKAVPAKPKPAVPEPGPAPEPNKSAKVYKESVAVRLARFRS